MAKNKLKKTAKKLLKSITRAKILFLVAALAAVMLYQAGAQNNGQIGSGSVSVGGRVGSTTLTISGYQSPYASIILKTSDGVFLASTTADAKGYFSISNVLINNSNLTYCFQAVDFKRIGVSESCITIPGPIVGDVHFTDVFLPPTIGLVRKQITAGEDAVIYGYTMPGAIVTLTIEGEAILVSADPTGYYSYVFKNVPAGTFTITANASLNDKASLPPSNDVQLVALSVTQQITDKGKEIVREVEKKVPFNIWPYLLLALALLVAIGVLLYKLKFGPWMIIVHAFRRRKKMHHDWFLDKW